MLKHKNVVGLAAMVVTSISMGGFAFAAEKENTDVSTVPAKAAVCDDSVDTTDIVDSNVTLQGLKKDKDGSYYVMMPDGTKITVTMAEPELGQDGNVDIHFICK